MKLQTVIIAACVLTIVVEVTCKKTKKKHKKNSGESSKGNPNAEPDHDYDEKIDHTEAKQLQQTFLAVLAALAASTSNTILEVSEAAQKLLEDLTDEGSDVLGMFAYMPEMLTMDAPAQFIASLQLVRKKMKETHGEPNLDDAVNTLIEWTEQMKAQSGQSQMKMASAITFWPTVLTGYHKFFKKMLRSVPV